MRPRTHGQSGHESSFGGGWYTWPTDRCSNKDAGRRDCKTPTLCNKLQAVHSHTKLECNERQRWWSVVLSADSLLILFSVHNAIECRKPKPDIDTSFPFVSAQLSSANLPLFVLFVTRWQLLSGSGQARGGWQCGGTGRCATAIQRRIPHHVCSWSVCLSGSIARRMCNDVVATWRAPQLQHKRKHVQENMNQLQEILLRISSFLCNQCQLSDSFVTVLIVSASFCAVRSV